MKKNIVLITGICLVFAIIGISFAWFNYTRTGDNNVLIVGDIYLNISQHGDSILLENALPETAEEARARNDNYIDFTVVGKNTSPKDIYYQIELLNGTDNGNKQRLNPEDLAFDLYSLNDQNEETLLLDAVSYEDLNNHKIWVDYVEKGTTSEISKKYRLRMWLAQKIVYGEGDGVKYTVDEFTNSFASVKIAVNGNLEEKSFPLKFSYDDANKKFLMTVWNDYFTRDDGIAADDNIVVRISDPDNMALFTYEDNNGNVLYNAQHSLQLPYTFDINKIINGVLKVSDIGKYGSDVKFEVLKNNVVVQTFLRTVYDENSTDQGTVISTITYNMPDGTTQTQNLYSGIINYIDVLVNDEGFQGWSSTYDGPVEYRFGDSINFTSNKTLYPVIREFTLVEIMRKDAVIDNVASEYVSASTGIDFGKVSSDTNGKGVYIRAGTENDDYPIVYYRGAVEDNNVLFNNKCWKAVRTTDTGGVKLIYNGEFDDSYTYITENGQDIYTYDNIDSTWNYEVNDGQNHEISFKVPAGDNYKIVITGTTGSSCGLSFDVLKDGTAVNGGGGGGGSAINFNYSYGTLTSSNVLKVSIYNASSTSSSCSVNLKINMQQGTEKLSFNDYSMLTGKTKHGCDSTGESSFISLSGTNKFAFNTSNNSPAYVGYMYGDVYTYNSEVVTRGGYYGSGFTYSNGVYTLTNTSTTYDETHHYTCNLTSAAGTCTTIRYYFYGQYERGTKYLNLTGGDSIEDAMEKMQINTNSSNAKTQIDSWYASNMNTVTSKLEDTIWCNDRSFDDGSSTRLNYGAYQRSNAASVTSTVKNQPSLACTNKNDAFTVSNGEGNGKLTYPVALLTEDEIVLAGGLAGTQNKSFYLYNGSTYYWSLSPHSFLSYGAVEFLVDSSGYLSSDYVSGANGLRPAVSLKPGTSVASGTGTVSDPFVIE